MRGKVGRKAQFPRRLNPHRPAIFLDIDGTLNNIEDVIQWCANHPDRDYYHEHRFDPKSIKVLNQIWETFTPYVVISSTWRFTYSVSRIQMLLRQQGYVGCLQGRTSDRFIVPVLNDPPDYALSRLRRLAVNHSGQEGY